MSKLTKEDRDRMIYIAETEEGKKRLSELLVEENKALSKIEWRTDNIKINPPKGWCYGSSGL